jgi:DAK2 domain fusion protein YloV
MGGQAAGDAEGIVDALGVKSWLFASLEALGSARAAIDSLNVFPIADGDTGTNMFLTLESCWEAVQQITAQPGESSTMTSKASADLAEVMEAIRTAAIMGARGNSGIITAEALRGICDVLVAGATTVDDLARALRAASDRATAAVAHPVEGTILTVAAAAAQAAEEQSSAGAAQDRESLRRQLLTISQAMHSALAHTTDQLEVLARAGVVDAGAQGLVLIYDALLDQMSGVRRRFAPVEGRSTPAERSEPEPMQHAATGDFEVMFLCETDEETIHELRGLLDVRGDSLVISGGPDLWNVHVHVDDAGETIEAVLGVVSIGNLKITHLPSQARTMGRSAAEPPSLRIPGRGIVAQIHGPGVRTLVEQAGATVVDGRPDRRPSTAEIVAAIDADGHEEVVVLPSDADTIPVAEVAADQARTRGVRISVIPTRSVVQTLAAIAVHDIQARFDDVVVAMADAARATRYAAITIATKEALTSAGRCQVGDVLGLVEGDIVEIGDDPVTVATAVVNRLMSSGGELVTLVVGTGAQPQLVDEFPDVISREHPGIDVDVIMGGQPLWPLIIGVE